MIKIKNLERIVFTIASNVAFTMVVASLSQCSSGRIYQPKIDDKMKEMVGNIQKSMAYDRRR